MLHSQEQALMVQGGTTAMHALDHNGHERQLGLPVRQWPHHGAVAGPPCLSLLHAAGIATLTPHGSSCPACTSCAVYFGVLKLSVM